MRVALLVDYPVLVRAVRAHDPEAVPAVARLVQRASRVGPLVAARGFGAWYDPDEALAAFGAGLDPAFLPPVGPGAVPSATALVAEGLALLREGRVDALVLSGDDRLLPLVARAQAEGMPVGMVAHSCATNGPCLRLADWAEPAGMYVRTLTRAERFRRTA